MRTQLRRIECDGCGMRLGPNLDPQPSRLESVRFADRCRGRFDPDLPNTPRRSGTGPSLRGWLPPTTTPNVRERTGGSRAPHRPLQAGQGGAAGLARTRSEAASRSALIVAAVRRPHDHMEVCRPCAAGLVALWARLEEEVGTPQRHAARQARCRSRSQLGVVNCSESGRGL
jgi:hypothetical protein